MAITKSLKENLKKYHINLPIDKRTKAFRDVFVRFADMIEYEEYLRGSVRDEKVNEKRQLTIRTRNIKKYNKYQKPILEQKRQNLAASKIQVEFARNKLFRTIPTTVWSSYFKYRLNEIRGLSEEQYFFLIGSELTDKTTYFTIEDFRKFFNFYKISMFLQKKL